VSLAETAQEVAALIPRFSWQLMDEEQRDDLMENVVLPRYMQNTSDGAHLGPTWWAEVVGASAGAIRKRIERLRRAQETDNPAGTRAEPNSRSGRAAATLRDPDKAAEILSDPDVRASVLRALDQSDMSNTRRLIRDTPEPRGSEPIELLTEFRKIHTTVARTAQLVIDGRAVVSEAERDALLDEVRWLRSALDHIESGLSAGSLDAALIELLEVGQ
jgi:hypothetical protein